MSSVPADDPALELVIDFLNTYDDLATPPDRLSIQRVTELLDRHGQPALALRASDLESLRRLRERLRPAFASPDAAGKAAAVDDVLRTESARATVVVDDAGTVALRATGGDGPVGQLAVLLADVLARALSTGGADRFGTCAADPCHCVYLDRTRSARQRYCCQLCNDRMAAAAYRRRSRAANPGPA
ncbi:CGNR zinc finger domain-containing protein [Paractinoplanes atraurantiacus]|uniref:ABATE domain-containing protein n=1 Tax=Paractinoplanes atraurantiacus TaxID=1036182 RepID=UPI0015CF45E3|nr:CGNR zinc finger domain-containing protein [Actinoplanes atraurantiacus]